MVSYRRHHLGIGSLYSPKHCGDLHNHRDQRCRQFEVGFLHGDRSRTCFNFGQSYFRFTDHQRDPAIHRDSDGLRHISVAQAATGRTISSSGLYAAPSTAGTYTITAKSVADTTKSAASTVTVTVP